jgi:hypothetical protein
MVSTREPRGSRKLSYTGQFELFDGSYIPICKEISSRIKQIAPTSRRVLFVHQKEVPVVVAFPVPRCQFPQMSTAISLKNECYAFCATQIPSFRL